MTRLFGLGEPSYAAEVKRKIFHQATLLYLAGYHLLGEKTSLHAMAVWMAAVAVVETARLKSDRVRDRLQAVFGGIVRDKERGRYTGLFYTSLGVLGVFFLFGSHPLIVTASILYLALGDAASALVGRRAGRHKFQVFGQQRSLEGTAAGFAAALLIGALVGLSPVLTVGGALAFLAADVLPIPPDDNLWIPLVTATTLFLLGL